MNFDRVLQTFLSFRTLHLAYPKLVGTPCSWENMGLFGYTTTEIREGKEIHGYLCGFGEKKSQLPEKPSLMQNTFEKKISCLTFISEVMNDD